MMRCGLFFLVLLVLAAPPAGAGSAWAAQGVSDSEIVLGVTSAFKGNSASLGTELYRGYMAYFAKVNAAGGINGRRIRVAAYDDGYDPARAFANTMQLAEKDKVFLLFGNVGTPTTAKVLPLLSKYKDIPLYLFAPFTGAQDFRDNPAIFNLRASYRQEAAELVDLLAGMGKRRIGVFYQNDSYGRSGYDGVDRALKSKGEKVAGEANYERGAAFDTPMKAQVSAILDAGANAIVCVGSYQACAAFVRDARKANFTGPIANISFVGSEALLALLAGQEKVDGRIYTADLYNSQVVPHFEDTSMEMVKRYRDDMQKFSLALPSALQDPSYRPLIYSFGSLEGYVNAYVLAEGLKRAGKDLTAEKLHAAIEGMNSLDIGLALPVSFSPSKHQGRDKVYMVKAAGGNWVPVK
jgi:branched-chain amino acid transport system substrate-binding protein